MALSSAIMAEIATRKPVGDRLDTASTRTPSPASSLETPPRTLPAGFIVPVVCRRTFLEFGEAEVERRRSASCGPRFLHEVTEVACRVTEVIYPGAQVTLASAAREAVSVGGVLVIVGEVSEVLHVDTLLEVRGDNATIRGLQVVGSGSLRISGVHVAGSVTATQASRLDMRDCSVTAAAGTGVLACGSSRVSLSVCRVSGCGENGISALDESSLTLDNCSVERNGHGHGVHVASSGRSTLTACVMKENGRNGTVVMASRGGGEGAVALRECRMVGNMAYGLAVHAGSAVLWEGGEVAGNRMGDCQGKRLLQGWEEAPKRKKKPVSRRLW